METRTAAVYNNKSGVLTSIRSRQCSAIGGRPLPEQTLFGPTHPSSSDSVVFLRHCGLYNLLIYLLAYLPKPSQPHYGITIQTLRENLSSCVRAVFCVTLCENNCVRVRYFYFVTLCLRERESYFIVSPCVRTIVSCCVRMRYFCHPVRMRHFIVNSSLCEGSGVSLENVRMICFIVSPCVQVRYFILSPCVRMIVLYCFTSVRTKLCHPV